VRAGGVPNIVEKIFTRDTTSFETSFQLDIFTQNYGLPKLQESQFQKFWDSQLGSLETK
jgi:hypothetical protein